MPMSLPPSTSSAKVHPCLPKALITRLESNPFVAATESIIYNADFNKLRCSLLRLSTDRDCIERECVMPTTQHQWLNPALVPQHIWEHLSHFREGDRKTFLHTAVRREDVLLAYEAIRLGLPIDRKDKDGATALFLAMEYIYALDIGVSDVLKSLGITCRVRALRTTLIRD